MTVLKFEKKETVSRKEAAARLSAIADALASDSRFELERAGESLKLDVPDEVIYELEVKIKDHETELEFEIKWTTEAS